MFKLISNKLKYKKMKTKKLIFGLTTLLFAFNANAQLKVDNSGKVGISTGTATISAQFQVGYPTNYNSSITAIGSDFRIGSYNSGTQYAFVSARDISTRSIGMVLRVQTSGSLYNAVTILPNGYFGIGSNIIPFYNLDVVGQINASVAVRAANIVLTSDERLKNNIKNLSYLSVSSIKNLQGVTYKLIPNGAALLSGSINPAGISKGDTANTQTTIQAKDTTFYNRNHIGFIAQDVQKVYPELVYSDNNGILSIDYIAFIPLLVESIKELNNNHVKDSLNLQRLQNKLNDIETQLNKCCGQPVLKNAQVSTTSIDDSHEIPLLYQNAPNPFNVNTTIAYYLPVTIQTAKLYIYNMQGVQIKVLPISDRSNGNIILRGNEFIPGMYLYTLVADGQEVDTKKMILTD